MKTSKMLLLIITILFVGTFIFADEYEQIEAFGMGKAAGLAWGDYNNDGYDDMLMVGSKSKVRYTAIWQNSGPPDYTFIDVVNLTEPLINDVGAAWADIDNDGDSDLVITGCPEPTGGLANNQPVRVYVNQGAPNYLDGTEMFYLGDASDKSESAAWADYDRDGFVDLLVANSEGPSRLFRNNGDLTFTETAQFEGGANSVAWWDINNDLQPDFALGTKTGVYVYMQNFRAGAIWFNETQISPLNGGPEGECFGMVWYDSKKYSASESISSNLIVNVKSSNALEPFKTYELLFKSNGEFISSIVTAQDEQYKGLYYSGSIIHSLYGIACSDYNHDGDMDYAQNIAGGFPNMLMKNTAESDNSLIRLIGMPELNDNHGSNTHAIGARMYHYYRWSSSSETYKNYRRINSGSGWASCNSFKNCCELNVFNFPSGITLNIENTPEIDLIGATTNIRYISETNEVNVYENGRIQALGQGFLGREVILANENRWGDINLDGYPDLVLSKNDSLSIYIYTGQEWPPFAWYCSVPINHKFDYSLGDYDNDGDLDIAVTTNSSYYDSNKLFVNNYPEASLSVSDQFGSNGRKLQWIDLNQDGRLDVVVVDNDYSMLWYENVSNTEADPVIPDFVEHVIYFAPSISCEASHRLAFADFNNDGQLDLLGPMGLTEIIDIESSTFYTHSDDPSHDPFACAVHPAWVDYDLDGDFDLLFNNHRFKNSSSVSEGVNFTDLEASYLNDSSFGDMDLDGHVDIFSKNGLYLNSGLPYYNFNQYTQYHSMTQGFMSLGDYDRDGDLDFYSKGWHSKGWCYENTHNYTGSMTIQLVGLAHDMGDSYSNRYAFGGIVKLFNAGTPTLTGHQIIGSGLHQVPGEALFGTPEDHNYDVQAVFPSGRMIDKTSNPALGNLNPSDLENGILIIYEDGRVEGLTGKSATWVSQKSVQPENIAIRQNYPNPFNPSTTVSYYLSNPAHVHAAIYNLSGQCVCRLIDEAQKQGAHQVTWHGTDNHGSKVGAGIYFCQIRSIGYQKTIKMMLLP